MYNLTPSPHLNCNRYMDIGLQQKAIKIKKKKKLIISCKILFYALLLGSRI